MTDVKTQIKVSVDDLTMHRKIINEMALLAATDHGQGVNVAIKAQGD